MIAVLLTCLLIAIGTTTQVSNAVSGFHFEQLVWMVRQAIESFLHEKQKNEKLWKICFEKKRESPKIRFSGYIFYEGFIFRNMQVHLLKGSTGRWDLGNSDTYWLAKVVYGCTCISIYLPHSTNLSFIGVFGHQMWLKMIVWIVRWQFSHSHMLVGTSSNIKLTLLHLYSM